MALVLAVAGVFGLITGSFLNVVIYRVPRHESLIRPGSRCPGCGTAIRPIHNVPVVSWVLLGGRCARCRQGISLRYPLVEAATAALFVAVTARLGVTRVLPAFLYLAAIGVALALIDVDVQRLPDSIVLPSYLVGLALLLLDPVWGLLGRSLLAMVALLAFYFLLALIHPGGIGYGDVKLAGLLGLYLGWLGWSAVLIGTFAGFVFGGLVGAGLLLTGRATRKSAIAFGPYMLAGAMLALFLAEPIANWYVSMLSSAS